MQIFHIWRNKLKNYMHKYNEKQYDIDVFMAC